MPPKRDHSVLLVSSARAELVKDSTERFPQEACGALFGTAAHGLTVIEEYRPLANIADHPLHAFALNPEEWVRCCFTPGLLGIFHSHPSSPPLPSKSDLNALQHFGSLLSVYLIGSFRTEDGKPYYKEKPPGSPDSFVLRAYSVVKQDNDSLSLSSLPMTCSEKRTDRLM
ncbi:Mov34/MPN/PAD-1 family protein [Paenibacillus sp. M1]|uniref:Mov34/MPN/PAD-1 family protein n=1 Tax=Paenibacillus haidiansis TaxID=1574488 RepID=A0ABU7VRK5_9BACL